MKKMFLMLLYVCFSFSLFACQNETQLRVAHISDNTGALSTNYSIKVVLDDDERLKDKYADLQIKSNQEEQFLKIGEENSEPVSIFLEKKDYWYNLTYLLDKANGSPVEGGYKKYDEFGNKVFNFTSTNDVSLTFRVVSGKTKPNQSTGEEILVLSEDVSDEVTIKVKKQ